MSELGNRYQLPDPISAFAGQINDLDAHEVIPASHWEREFGSEVAAFYEACTASRGGQAPLVFNPNQKADDAEINSNNVWNLKMERAPGSFDFERRIEVMDYIGIRRQIMYPGSMGLLAHAFYNTVDNPNTMRSITGDRKAYARRLIELYNDWCVRLYGTQDRLRPTAMLVEDDPDELYASMKKFIDKGVRLFLISCNKPPAGMSPADPRLDRVWALAADAGVALLAHIDPGEGFLSTLVWRDAPAFKGWMHGAEFSLDPWTLSNIHLGVQNYLMTMVLGGVFDRHPKLRFGTAEFGAHWVGPFAENMDRWYAHTPFPTDIGERKLKMRPSDYVRQNIRVACFDFEPVGQYIERYGFEDVFCFATDYPHYEGGKQPMERFTESLSGLGADVLRKFFVENGKLLLPD